MTDSEIDALVPLPVGTPKSYLAHARAAVRAYAARSAWVACADRLPEGWRIDHIDDITIAVQGPIGACVVRKDESDLRTIPAQILYGLCASLIPAEAVEDCGTEGGE